MFPVLSQNSALWMLCKHIDDNEELYYHHHHHHHHRHYNCNIDGAMAVSYVPSNPVSSVSLFKMPLSFRR
jgi:Fe2+ or Zn2+ uptake regulation protein